MLTDLIIKRFVPFPGSTESQISSDCINKREVRKAVNMDLCQKFLIGIQQ